MDSFEGGGGGLFYVLGGILAQEVLARVPKE